VIGFSCDNRQISACFRSVFRIYWIYSAYIVKLLVTVSAFYINKHPLSREEFTYNLLKFTISVYISIFSTVFYKYDASLLA